MGDEHRMTVRDDEARVRGAGWCYEHRAWCGRDSELLPPPRALYDDRDDAEHDAAVADVICMRMIAANAGAIRDYLAEVPEESAAHATAELLARQLAVILEAYEERAARKD